MSLTTFTHKNGSLQLPPCLLGFRAPEPRWKRTTRDVTPGALGSGPPPLQQKSAPVLGPCPASAGYWFAHFSGALDKPVELLLPSLNVCVCGLFFLIWQMATGGLPTHAEANPYNKKNTTFYPASFRRFLLLVLRWLTKFHLT